MNDRAPNADSYDDDERIVVFGIAAFDSEVAAAEVTFPTDSRTLLATIGDVQIPYNVSGRTIALSDALDEAATDEFETKQELLNELHPVFETARREQSNPWLDKLRSVLPTAPQ